MTTSCEDMLEHLIADNLSAKLMAELMERILSGAMPDAQIAASLALMRARGDSMKSIGQAAFVVLNKSLAIDRPDYVYADIVGTGGDGHNTINVSTLASLVAASLGLAVAKHGNASVSSKCGSADLLRELGVNYSMPPALARKSLDEHNWCFLFAPIYHPAFQSVKSIRSELKIKTIFNLLGPLVNPMAPPVMLIGVYHPDLIMPFINALKDLNRPRALVVHGSGLDEIALHGPTTGAVLDHSSIEPFVISPKDLGLSTFDLKDIYGGEAQENAAIAKHILAGQADDAKTSMVAASAGVLLWLGGRAKDLVEGVRLAKDALRSGLALKTLAAAAKGVDDGA